MQFSLKKSKTSAGAYFVHVKNANATEPVALITRVKWTSRKTTWYASMLGFHHHSEHRTLREAQAEAEKQFKRWRGVA